MMRLLVFLLSLACASAWGGEVTRAAPPPFELQVLWSNPYDYEWMTWGFGCSGSSRVQDDFELEAAGLVKGFEGWFTYHDVTPPKPFIATIFADADSKPGSELWTADISQVVVFDTGDDFWFDDSRVWHTIMFLEESDYTFIEAGRRLWLELYFTYNTAELMCEDIGNLYFNGERKDFSAFFSVLG
ncbi:MAG TPA: hypothetical protein ENN88_03185, partial [Candidatus Coatesbacteria bacterium]|nr:hypothetical protein [Candidatus Coatesbacteria bacterium]